VRFSLHRRAQSRAAGSARAPRPPGRLIPSRAARHALWPPHGPVPAGMLADKTPDQGGNPQPDRARFRHRLHGGARMAPQVRRSQPRASALAGLLLLPVGYCLGGAAQWRWWGAAAMAQAAPIVGFLARKANQSQPGWPWCRAKSVPGRTWHPRLQICGRLGSTITLPLQGRQR